ncbi:MAG: hypothetical protein LBN25_02305, partial [Christensenellaceae bacterium]|nr:hypothetical protein [Christensenellaceae bacterium]
VNSFSRQSELREDGFYLNGKKTFLKGIIYTAFYATGGFTAPTDDYLKKDVAEIVRQGFNAVYVKGVTVSDKFKDYCDRLGLLIIEELPSRFYNFETDSAQTAFIEEYTAIVNSESEHPSVVLRVPLPDYIGGYDYLRRVFVDIKALDPSRPALAVSGAVYGGDGLGVYVNSLTEQGILRAVIGNENLPEGFEKAQKFAKQNPQLLPPDAVAAMPKFVACFEPFDGLTHENAYILLKKYEAAVQFFKDLNCFGCFASQFSDNYENVGLYSLKRLPRLVVDHRKLLKKINGAI